MSLVWYLLWFLVAVSLLVTVHEFGHYWVARRLGFKVLRFSVGFGRPLLSRTLGPDRTEYVLAAIPLGGYVKMLDEREGEVSPEDLPRSFTRRPPWQRILVLLAGPFCNLLFAVILLWGMYWSSGLTEYRPVVGDVTAGSVAARAGLRTGDEIQAIDGQRVGDQSDVMMGLLDVLSAHGQAVLAVRGSDGDARAATLRVPDPEQRRHLTEPAELMKGVGFEFFTPPVPPVLGQVLPDGPAAKAGLRSKDLVVSIDGTPIRDFREVVTLINSHPGDTLAITYRRAGVENTVRVQVVGEQVDGKRLGFIHVKPQPVQYPASLVRHTALTPLAALEHATAKAWDMTLLQGRLFFRMVLGQVSLKNLSGPLSIAEFAGDSAQAGVASFMSFLVLISLSLGFLNLLPIPILDGGQIAFQLIEWLKGSPLSERAQIFSQQIGFALLLLLMGVALYNDIARQLS
jgi:regulator of sigma E protease